MSATIGTPRAWGPNLSALNRPGQPIPRQICRGPCGPRPKVRESRRGDRRLPDPRGATDQHQRPGHQSTTKDPIELPDPGPQPLHPRCLDLTERHRRECAARRAWRDARPGAADARFSSAIVFHSPQPGQRPCHFGLSCPHELQAKTVAERGIPARLRGPLDGLAPPGIGWPPTRPEEEPMRSIRFRLPSPSMAVALLALFVALGGSAYAALKVGSKQIVNNSVRSTDLRNNDVRSKDVRNNALTGADVNESTLGTVPSAATAAQCGDGGEREHPRGARPQRVRPDAHGARSARRHAGQPALRGRLYATSARARRPDSSRTNSASSISRGMSTRPASRARSSRSQRATGRI